MNETAKHTLSELIYEGSDTLLYRGYRKADGAAVTLKIPKSSLPSLRELAKLRHEYALLQNLKIPGVIRAYELEPLGSSLALVLEYVHSQPLIQLINQQKLDLRASLQVAVSTVKILEQIHAQGIIHKDIKPQKVRTGRRRLEHRSASAAKRSRRDGKNAERWM